MSVHLDMFTCFQTPFIRRMTTYVSEIVGSNWFSLRLSLEYALETGFGILLSTILVLCPEDGEPIF